MLTFFNIFPYLTSAEFYILSIALGYWITTRKRLFIELGYLIPISTIINCSLKNIFSPVPSNIPTYLIWIHDMVGFPSGDAHMASVFWCVLAINYKSKYFQIFAVAIIILIGISRVYLGIHSIIDVMGGIGFGIITIIIWYKDYVVKSVDNWFKGETFTFWVTVISATTLLTIASPDTPIPPGAALSLGLLIGLGFVFKISTSLDQDYNFELLGILLSLLLLMIFTLYIPIIRYNHITIWGTIIAKFGFVMYNMYYFLPKLQSYIYNRRAGKIE